MLGIVKEPFRAIVIDTDRYSKSLFTFQGFFDALRQAGYPGIVPYLRSEKLEQLPAPGARIHDVMEVRDLPETGYHHPLQSLYGRELLAMKATEGLFSRPAASALVVPNIADLIRETDVQSGTKVLVLASTIGGTGAGLSLQLMSRAQELGWTQKQLHSIYLNLNIT